MEKLKTFVAIDFEWQSPDHDPCAVGLVKVKNNVVVEKFYSLIRPKADVWDEHCCRVHGITREMVTEAHTLNDLGNFIEWFVSDSPLVGHNFNTAERCVIEKHFREDSPLKNAHFIDTFTLLGGTLAEQCTRHGIPLMEHHDALADAIATAMLYIKVQGEELLQPVTAEAPAKKKSGTKRDSSLNYAVAADQVPHPDTPFMGAKFVVSGFPDAQRDKLIALLRDQFGGQNQNNIGPKTKILVGHSEKCGPSKRAKATEQGCLLYDETSLYAEVIVPCGLEGEWKEIFG